MQRLYLITSCLALCILLACGSRPQAWADAKPRIFVGTIEYLGPAKTIDGVVFVDALRFALSVGWSARKADGGGVAVAAAPDSVGTPPDTGLTVNSHAFTGQTRTEDGALFVSLNDLADSLQGQVKAVPEYQMIRVDIPGMPTTAAVDQRVTPAQRLQQALQQSPYTLIEYYLPSVALCKDIQPALAQAQAEFKNVRQVHVNVEAPGADRVYLQFKQPDQQVPEVVLVDSQGHTLVHLRGNHIIAHDLIPQMTKSVTPPQK